MGRVLFNTVCDLYKHHYDIRLTKLRRELEVVWELYLGY